MDFLKRIREANRFVRTILMTVFRLDDKMFREYTKNKIINTFLQKPIGIQDPLKEVDTQCIHTKCNKDSFLVTKILKSYTQTVGTKFRKMFRPNYLGEYLYSK